MKNICKIVFVALVLIISANTLMAQTCKLVVEVYGLKNNEGELDLTLFDSETGFPSDATKAVKHIRVKPSGNKGTLNIETLKYGTYAFIVYHDANSDHVMNKAWYGKPEESVVVSNYASGFMKAPSFNDAKFELNAPIKFVSLKIHVF